MARTVDPARHEQRRLHIIDAALTCFAERGYEGATTASICRRARIGSGTFFHYFPTKAAVLVAILEYGTAETRGWFATRHAGEDARRVVDAYVAHALDDLTDPRTAGFVRAVSAVMSAPDIAVALRADDAAVREGLEPWMERARESGQVRRDLSAARLTRWLMLLLDGFVGAVAAEPAFTVDGERDALLGAVTRLLAP